MKFTEILEELKKGEKVTREKWEKDKTKRYKYIQLEHGKCIAFLKDDVSKDIYQGADYMGCIFDIGDFTAEDWKLYKEKKTNKKWKPKEGDTYFYISGTGKVISDNFMPLLPSDNAKVLFNNAFQTAEEAEYMVEKIKIINKLRELSNINFNDTSGEVHYAIAYDSETNEITSYVSYYYKYLPFNIYFATEEALKKAVETIGEDNLKKYYFDIVEEDN